MLRIGLVCKLFMKGDIDMMLYLKINILCFCYILYVLTKIRKDLPDLSDKLGVKIGVALTLFVLAPAIAIPNIFFQLIELMLKVIKWMLKI